MDHRIWAFFVLLAAVTLSIVAEEELTGENVCTVRKNITEQKMSRDLEKPGGYKFLPIVVEKDVRECCDGFQPTQNGTACEPAVLLADRSSWFIWFVVAGVLALAASALLAVFGYKHKKAAAAKAKEHSVKYTTNSADESDDEDLESNNRVFRPDFVPQVPAGSSQNPEGGKPVVVQKTQTGETKTNEYVELGANAAATSNNYESIPTNPRKSQPASFENPNRSSTQPLLKKTEEEEE